MRYDPDARLVGDPYNGGESDPPADRNSATSMDTMRTHCSPEKGRKGVLGNGPIT